MCCERTTTCSSSSSRESFEFASPWPPSACSAVQLSWSCCGLMQLAIIMVMIKINLNRHQGTVTSLASGCNRHSGANKPEGGSSVAFSNAGHLAGKGAAGRMGQHYLDSEQLFRAVPGVLMGLVQVLLGSGFAVTRSIEAGDYSFVQADCLL